MWFLTYDGLNRYDGYTFKIYRYSPEHADYIMQGWFSDMVQDSSGIIWMDDTNAGVYAFDPIKEKFIHYVHNPKDENSLCDDINFGLTEVRNGRIWIPTENGLDELSTRTGIFKHYHHIAADSSSISSNFVSSTCMDEDGNLWVVTAAAGIDYFNPATGKVTQHFNYGSNTLMIPDANAEIYRVNTGRNGNIWINSRNNGIFYYNTRTKSVKHLAVNQKNADWNTGAGIVNTYEDSNSNLWMVNPNGGIMYYESINRKYFHLDSVPALSTQIGRVNCFYEDRSGRIWIGSDNGAFALDAKGKKFNHYFHDADNRNSIADNYVFSIYRDSRGQLYVGGGGLNLMDDKFRKFRHLQLLENGKSIFENNMVWQIREDSKGILWFATGNGLVKYDPATGKHIRYSYNVNDSTSVSAQSVTGIIEDRKGRYWCTTFGGGFDAFDPATGKFRAFEEGTGKKIVSTNSLGNLFEDSHGILYMGSWNGGLVTFNPDSETFKIYRHDFKNPSSLSCDIVFDFLESRNGIVWVCTLGGGLNAFNPSNGKCRSFTTKDGLADNAVNNIVEDGNGNFWLGTANGISCFTPPANPFDSSNKFHIRNYDESDGLPEKQMNGFDSFKDDDGTIYIGTETAGLISFKPDELENNDFVPPVYITDLKLFNKTVLPKAADSVLKSPAEFTNEIKLSYKQNVISFEFAALNYFHPEKNQYAYKLDGFDKDWIYTDASKRFADYTSLDAGEYIFEVKGSNNDGVWNNSPAMMQLIITPPYWQTWWFRAGMVVVIAIAIYGLYRFRLSQVIRLQQIRNRIAHDLHDDIGSTLNSISVYSELIKKDPLQQTYALNMIGASSRKVIDAMGDIVWAINPENDSIDKIILRMRALSYNLLRAKKIEYTFRADEEMGNVKLSMEKRRNLFLIFKEVLNNVIKYSEAKRSEIRLTHNNGTLRLLIRDDGIGFDPAVKYNGNGLNSIRKRAQEMHAKLNIQSGEGIGTSVELIVKA